MPTTDQASIIRKLQQTTVSDLQWHIYGSQIVASQLTAITIAITFMFNVKLVATYVVSYYSYSLLLAMCPKNKTPLSVCRKVQVVKYCQRLCNENDLPNYLREAYLLAKSEKLKWYTNIMDIF